MDRILTQDQKHELAALEELERQPGWKIIKEFIEASIQEREDILTGKKEVGGLDDIKFSANTVLRKELYVLRSIVDYYQTTAKGAGIYQANDATSS